MDAINKYIANFNFHSPDVPLNKWQWPIAAVGVYLVVIYSIQYWVERRRLDYLKKHAIEPSDKDSVDRLSPELWAVHIKLPFAVHNLFLSLASLVMCVATAREMWLRTEREGSGEWTICEHQTTPSGPLYFWSYLYYLSKYVELIDTCFLALKGRLEGWGGLQVYHHSVILVLSFLWIDRTGTLQFWGLVVNTFVHVVMYFYFFLTCLGFKPPIRRVITFIQIAQFVFSVVLAVMSARLHLLQGRECNGQYILYGSILFNITLLSEFAAIFRDKKGADGTGSKRSRKEKPAPAATQ